MKDIITHIRPHLDEIGAIWLIKKFFDGWEDPGIIFISADKGNLGLVDASDVIHIGVGRGKYDEHKGDLEKSSMLLVWEDIKKGGKAPKGYLERNALDELVNWSNLIDNARLPYDEYSVASFIRASTNESEDSRESLELGLKILDLIFYRLIFKQVELAEWDKRADFQSKWGKSTAIESANFRDFFAFRQGYNIVVRHNPQSKYLGVTAPRSADVDLTSLYERLVKLNPKADWFFHQSKRMVVCGDETAPDATRASLTLKQLVEIVKSIK